MDNVELLSTGDEDFDLPSPDSKTGLYRVIHYFSYCWPKTQIVDTRSTAEAVLANTHNPFF